VRGSPDPADHRNTTINLPSTGTIALIGYRGTGKTTVARIVAGELGWTSADSDLEIEHRWHKSVARVFAEQGEHAFREMEVEVIRELLGRPNCVLAVGGGAVLEPENRQALRTATAVLWLTASPPTIWQRIQNDPDTPRRRPNLTDAGGLEEIVDLLRLRTPLYSSLADHRIDTERRTPDDVAQEVLRALARGTS
jgi:shikimate kinase